MRFLKTRLRVLSNRQCRSDQRINVQLSRAKALPAVRSVALSHALPFNQGIGQNVAPEGYTFQQGQESASVFSSVVDENFFETMKIEIVCGRAFTPADNEDSRRVVILNEKFAKKYWTRMRSESACA
jgi:hypothetical protein